MMAELRRRIPRWALPGLFSLTLFLSAALLFVAELMVARMALPLLGGTPAVWNTCMVFFQGLLLAGYAYAQVVSAWLAAGKQVALHLAALAAPFLLLPVAMPTGWSPPTGSYPIAWLLALLSVAVGLPFFVLATTAPLLQRWFSATEHPSAADPYILYAASNLGSLLALFAYPLVVEPNLTLAEQAQWWSVAYLVFFGLAAGCASAVWRSRKQPLQQVFDVAVAIAWPRRWRWLLLSFAASSLMLSVTGYLTTDVAAMPLLWVMPLAVYLLTFVLAFARRPPLTPMVLGRWLPLAALLLVLTLLSEATEPPGVLVMLHLGGLFWVCSYCHSSVAADRPPPGRLVEFYLWLALGGVLGGIFNALVAPLLFSRLIEYPLALVLVCLLRSSQDEKKPSSGRLSLFLDLTLPLVLGYVTAAIVVISLRWGLEAGPLRMGLMFAAPAALCYTFHGRTLRFALGLGGLLIAGSLGGGVHGTTEYRLRSFFGVHRVTRDSTGTYRMLVHGNTVHGKQSLDPQQRREPLTYYTRTGPIGRVFAILDKRSSVRNVGVVGLGSGALCCYARPGDRWTFYEIDPAVLTIARDLGLFTYWQDCAVEPAVVLGDARLQLARCAEKYDLLVIDAFSSDAVPVHLLTREALSIYRSHLADGGILAFHISNRYLDLAQVLADLAGDAHPPLFCLRRQDRQAVDYEINAGWAPSEWIVMAEYRETILPFRRTVTWEALSADPQRRVWTDDFTSIFGVFRWSLSDY
jgi:hypothetical protein